MENSIVIIVFIIILIILYYYHFYKNKFECFTSTVNNSNKVENKADKRGNKENENKVDESINKEVSLTANDVLHDTFFLDTPTGFKNAGIIRDYGNIIERKYVDILTDKPNNINDIVAIVNKAKDKKKKIRIRGGGHSSSGISIPRSNEVFIEMRRMNRFSFDSVGTITVNSGVALNDLMRFLQRDGFVLPVYPYGVDLLDKTSPTVGGFICGGGISPDSKLVGGLWENILEIKIVDSYGKINIITPENELFRWLFGSYGQFGIIISAKLKINHIEKNKDFYPLGKKGIIDVFKYKLGDRKSFSFHIFCEKEKIDMCINKLTSIIQFYYDEKENKNNFNTITYFIKNINFIPPLLYKNNSFYCVQSTQYIEEKDDIYKKHIKQIDKELNTFIDDNLLYRYIQVEYTNTDNLKDYYIKRGIYDKFLIIKQKYDPDNIFNPIDNFSTL